MADAEIQTEDNSVKKNISKRIRTNYSNKAESGYN